MMRALFGHGRLRLYLLKLLDEEPRHGYDIIKQLEDRFLGVYAPSAGTVYPRLSRLEEEGLVSHQVAEGRKVYQLTDAGREELGRRQEELAELERDIDRSVHDLAAEVREDVRSSVRQIREELKTAARQTRENRSRRQYDDEDAHGAQWPGMADVPGWDDAMRQVQDAVRQATEAVRGSGREWLGDGAGAHRLSKGVLGGVEQLRAEIRTAVKSGVDEEALRELQATVDLARGQVRDLVARSR
ncbi:MAG: PadR family transcriptional regulator [Streptosporangiales bacterium]